MLGMFASTLNQNQFPPEGGVQIDPGPRFPRRGEITEMVSVEGELYVATGARVYTLKEGALVRVPFQEDLDAIAEYEKEKNVA